MGEKRKATSTISKTKALAIRRKAAPTTVIKSHGGSPKEILLAKMMEQHIMMENDDSSISFANILSNLNMNDRNTKWRNAWRELEGEGHVENSTKDGPVFTSGFKLTESGIDLASTEEYKKHVNATASQPKSEAEFYQNIKSKLMNKRGDQILDLLLEHGPSSRKELAGFLGISDTGAHFSYALQQLKDLGYAENITIPGVKGKKVQLTAKAFFSPEAQMVHDAKKQAKKSVEVAKVESKKKQTPETKKEDDTEKEDDFEEESKSLMKPEETVDDGEIASEDA